MRVICEYQAYVEPHLTRIVRPFSDERDGPGAVTTSPRAMHAVASEARTIEGRLSKSDWVVGESFSAADMVIFPGIQLLLRALERPAGARACPPASCPWRSTIRRSAAGSRASRRLPGYERTYPPHRLGGENSR